MVIGEVAYALTLFLIGLGVAAPLRREVSWTGVSVMAYPVGLSTVVTVSWLGPILRLPYEPVAAHVVAALIGVGGVVVARRRPIPHPGRGRYGAVAVAVTAAVIAVVAVLTTTFTLARVTTDSFRYLQVGSVLEIERTFAAISPIHLVTRPPFVPLAHAPANTLLDAYYFRALTPLLTLSGIVCLAWFAFVGLRRAGLSRSWCLLLPVGPILIVTSSGAFLYHAFYLNGHMASAVYILLLVAGSWMALTTTRPEWVVVAGLALPGIVLTRPEGAVVAAVLVLPVLADPSLPLRLRGALYGTLAVVTGAWFGTIVRPYAVGELPRLESSPDAALVVVALTGLALLVPAVPRLRLTGERTALLLLGAVIATVGGLAIRDRALFDTTVSATTANMLRMHHWGVTWIALVVLVAAVVVLGRFRGWHVFVVPVLGALPLLVGLAFARGTPYRYAIGDSGNRMLLHFALVAVLFVALGLGTAIGGARLRSAQEATEGEVGRDDLPSRAGERSARQPRPS